MVANNGLNKGLVLSQHGWWNSTEHYAKKSTLSLEINEFEKDIGDLWPLAGGPKSSLDWLSRHLTKNNLVLSEGDIVLGGTALGLHYVQSGESITLKVDGEVATRCCVK